jgi:hypothetical protein
MAMQIGVSEIGSRIRVKGGPWARTYDEACGASHSLFVRRARMMRGRSKAMQDGL